MLASIASACSRRRMSSKGSAAEGSPKGFARDCRERWAGVMVGARGGVGAGKEGAPGEVFCIWLSRLGFEVLGVGGGGMAVREVWGWGRGCERIVGWGAGSPRRWTEREGGAEGGEGGGEIPAFEGCLLRRGVLRDNRLHA